MSHRIEMTGIKRDRYERKKRRREMLFVEAEKDKALR